MYTNVSTFSVGNGFKNTCTAYIMVSFKRSRHPVHIKVAHRATCAHNIFRYHVYISYRLDSTKYIESDTVLPACMNIYWWIMSFLLLNVSTSRYVLFYC